MRSLQLAFCGLVGASACGEPAERDVAARTQWIVDGELDMTPQVVLVYNSRRGSMCTGSLVAPRVVLTAKHCVQTDGAAGPDVAGAFTVGIGDSIRSLSESLRAAEITTTPGMYDSRLRGLIGVDIALITLQTGVTAHEPLAVYRGDRNDLIGKEVIAIGYGQTPSGRSGTKYRVSGRVRYLDGNVLYTSPITCQGDSGGPILDAETGLIVGITSFGSGGCGAGGTAGANLVEPYADMIDEVVGGSGSCLNDGAERCDGFDNDCNDLIDETCLPLGSECTSDDECLGNACRETPAGRLCTSDCDPLRPELSCSTGLYCARTSGCEGLCVPLPTDRGEPAGNGADCETDLDCMSLFCADPGDGHRRCLTSCRGDDGTCLGGEACAAPAGLCGGCVDAAIVVGARGLGEPCESDDACGSDQCLEEAGLAYCTRSCETDSECGSADRFHCRDGVCALGALGGVGDSCISNGDCGEGSFCAFRGDVSWCTTFCDADECPEGFECTPVADAQICVPERGVVGDACSMADECISGVCEDGRCTRLCGTDSACTGGFECRRTEDGTAAYCLAPPAPPEEEATGCSVGHGRSAHPMWMLLVAALLLGWRRRALRAGLVPLLAVVLTVSACSESKEPPADDDSITFMAPDTGPAERPAPDEQAPDAGATDPLPIDIGIACMSDADCEVFCITAGEGFRDGYCTSYCSDTEPCGDGSTCVQVSEMQSLCLANCDPSAAERPCRAGYGCAVGVSLPTPVCIPGCTDDSDCDAGRTCNPQEGGACYNPESTWGAACERSSDCPDGAACMDEEFRGYPGGMCIAFGCDSTATDGGGCPEGTVCIEGRRAGFGRCLPSCADDAGCRRGYACRAPDAYPERLACQPGCEANDQCTGGRSCSTDGTCR